LFNPSLCGGCAPQKLVFMSLNEHTAGTQVRTRDQLYLDLLGFGLLRVRNLAHDQEARLCEIEADHLHNIPSLVGEGNEHRHAYYFDDERKLYLERVGDQLDDFTRARYEELWTELQSLSKKERLGS